MSGIKIRVPVPSGESLLPFTITSASTAASASTPETAGFFVGGPTYDIKEDLKKFGARWNVGAKKWWVPSENLAPVKALLLTKVPLVASESAAPIRPVGKVTVAVDDEIIIRLRLACAGKSYSAGGLNVDQLRMLAAGKTKDVEHMSRAALLSLLCATVPSIRVVVSADAPESVGVAAPLGVAASAPLGGAGDVAISRILSPEAKLRTFDDLLKSLGVSDVTLLTTLSAEEIDHLISILTLHDSAIRLIDVAPADLHGRIRKLIEELGGKLCRCIKKVIAKSPELPESSAIPICINSIFNRRGLKISTFKCKDGELLLPAAESTIVLDHQPGFKKIVGI